MSVGVLVPVHGFAPYLAEALDSVLRQDPPPDRVVVVDDGSPHPLSLHPDHAGRVTLLRREQAGGPAAARASGLDLLEPNIDLIALCDADDAWEPGKLAAQVAALAQEPGAGWAFGRALVVGPDGRATGERWDEPAPGRHTAGAMAAALYAANSVPTSSVVIYRAALEAAGGFAAPVRVAEDWELWLRLSRAGHDALCVPGARVRYRRHPGGLTADVTGLAEAQLAVHTAHADLVDGPASDAARAQDLTALAAGRARSGRYRDARAALREAGRLRAATPRERALLAVLAVPGARALLGRRDPYRR